MSEPQHYVLKLTLEDKFLKWVYSHRLLNQALKTDGIWKDTSEQQQFNFGGLHGKQFKSSDEIESFNKAFNQLLEKHNIKIQHKHNLLYFIIFLFVDSEAQSLANNASSRLVEYAKFILDLYGNGKRHFESMSKKKEYQMIYDEATQEFFFAKKNLYETVPLHELVELIPDKNEHDSIIRYLRITVGNGELYVSPNLSINVTSEDQLRAFTGKAIPHIKFPNYLHYEVLTYAARLMIEAHRCANTPFYQYLIGEEVSEQELKKVYNQYKKSYISQSKALLRVAIMISDYLKEQKIITVKRRTADFLFGYFSLFKAFKVETTEALPDNYEALSSYYKRNGINSEKVRMMLKDVGEI